MKNSLEFSDSVMTYRDNSGKKWSSNVDDLILIAEYTTDEGPDIDDYFFVFVTSENGTACFSKCTLYAEGTTEVLTRLGKQLSFPLSCGLCNSTKWASRILWPPQFENCEYFTFTEVAADGLWSKLRKFFLGPRLEYVISDPVLQFIHSKVSENKSGKVTQ